MPSWPLDPDRFRQRTGGDGNLVLFLNGILTLPGNQFAWTDRAERWFSRNTAHDVDSYEYFHSALFGLFQERRQTAEAAELLAGYLGSWSTPPTVHLVGHSRGCELARRLIVDHGVRVKTLHLFSAAIDADFGRNGLQAAMLRRQLGHVACYTSDGDQVLRRVAPLSLGLYGRLGYTGPADSISLPGVSEVRVRTFGHGDWFAGWNFLWSMQQVEEGIAAASDELP